MSESLTLTREWMELLRGIADAEERWKVLSAVFAFANTENAKKTDMTDGLSPIGECVFMSICERIMKRKRDNRYLTNRRTSTADIRRKKSPTFDAKNADNRRSDDLFDLSSNQHIDTSITPHSLFKNKQDSPHGEKSTARRAFKVPSFEEVKDYIRHKGYSVDPEEFFSFYESQGWRVGRNPMRDWHKAISYWQCRINNRFKTRTQLRDHSGI